MNQIKRILALIFLILPLAATWSAWIESPVDYHQRMKWWKDGRLGMFLHWGVYSTFGGEYNGRDYGKEMGNASAEWIYLKSNMPREDYEAAAKRFNPVDYNPREWARMANEAGMSYMVLTSKHHDGFALFDTDASDWNAVKSSGAKRDLFREYVDACRAEGLKVGFYYSHEKDWTHHARLNRDPDPLSDEYINVVKTHLQELFTNYGTIDLIWFDTPMPQHEAFNRMCAETVRKLQPNCIINGRIGNELGDYRNIGDRAIVDPGEEGYYESIMTMRVNWGYDRNDDYWKSSNELIGMVCKSACRGSNFLLNIGPTPQGTFPLEDQVRLYDLGRWMQVNGESIKKTEGSPFLKDHEWGSLTQKPDAGILYLHLYNWKGGPVVLKGLKSKVQSAQVLGMEQALPFEQDSSRASVTFSMPGDLRSEPIPVIKLTTGQNPKLDLSKGPNYTPEKVHYVTAAMIRGTLTKVEGIHITVEGRREGSHRDGYQEPSEKPVKVKLSLNDNVRFRISKDGDIRSVQSFPLVTGANYEIVYGPDKQHPDLRIITLVQ